MASRDADTRAIAGADSRANSHADTHAFSCAVSANRLVVGSSRRIGNASQRTAIVGGRGAGSVGVSGGSVPMSADRVNQQVQSETLHNFRNFCTRLNVDPLDAASVHAALILFSRAFSTLQGSEVVELTGLPESIANVFKHMDWDALCPMRDNPAFHTIHDWSSLIMYLETSGQDADEQRLLAQIMDTPLVQNTKRAIEKSGIGELYSIDNTRLLILTVLHLVVSPTPQEKMLERLFSKHARSMSLAPPHDLELRCLRLVTHFNNTLPEPAKQKSGLLMVLSGVRTSAVFTEAMTSTVVSATVSKSAEQRQGSRGGSRLRLRYVAKTVDSMHIAYDHSFANWANLQRFPITTSVRMQQVLYFLHVQVRPTPVETYTLYFPQPVAERVMNSTVDVIEVEPLHAISSLIRSYQHNVSDLIDFRAGCLGGISHSLRSTLSLAQVLQLYICAFQHVSVREILWRRVVNVWNYSIQSALASFTASHEFDLPAILHTIMSSIAGVDARAGRGGGAPASGGD